MNRERIPYALLWSISMGVCAVLVWIVVDLCLRGIGPISWEFFSQPPTQSGREGGIAPMIVSTLWIVAVATSVALPLGFFSAVLLSNGNGRRFPSLVRSSLDMLNAVPSIVFGLFGNALFCIALGMGYSILSGGLTLACMILPILIRTMEQSLSAVPADQRLAASALGLSKTTTLFRILAPQAAPGMAVGLILGVGRALSETAALIFTAGYVTRFPGDVFDSGRAISVHIFDLAMNVPGADQRAYASALVLVVALFAINGGVRVAARRFSVRLAA
ncbi:MAG: phosphate transport system permease protein [Planctomycetota bacterium]|jgi:phosphate transport system permease protein